MGQYTDIIIFIFGSLAFLLGGLFTSWILRPKRPNDQKLSTYESGEEPLGSARGRVNARFYLIALIFLLFEVEIIFLFPWSTVFGNKELIDATNGLWGWFALTEMFVFIGILGLGLAYVWKKGHLDWPKSETKVSDFKSPVPAKLYEKVNRKYSG
mgnify:CR=1 FL=1